MAGMLKTRTELLKEIEKLREQRELYRTLVETSPDGIALTDLQGVITACNRKNALLHGYDTPEDMIGKLAFDLVSLEDRAPALENLQKTLATGRSGVVEYRLLRKDGSHFYGEVNVVLVRDAQKNPCSLAAIIRDTTEKRSLLIQLGKAGQIVSDLESPKKKSKKSGVRGRILVIDDEPGVGSAIKRILIREHTVVVATSGEDGIEILKDDSAFDLILCDLMMPEITGMDLFQWVVDTHPDLVEKFVFITGGVFTARARKFIARVKNVVMEKPFDSVELSKKVAELIRATKGK
jgi:PAS domain S-box-containing protein